MKLWDAARVTADANGETITDVVVRDEMGR
jgi:hypothetical protein